MYLPTALTPVQAERARATKAAEHLIATMVREELGYSKDESVKATMDVVGGPKKGGSSKRKSSEEQSSR